MATLHCRHCGGSINSDARRTQCRECGELFPFQCDVCDRKLRTPFPVYEDERYLTNDEADPKPLCSEHFLRHCPECKKWFHADENPGFFRCASCAGEAEAKLTTPEWDDGGRFEMEPPEEREVMHAAPIVWRGRFDPNTLVLSAAGCAFIALLGWYLLAR
ncbi:hypothetical protein EON80_12490 [bacterium]|nr:MAG: hypothetical protein EON80_12490 [bacterium]